MRWWTLGQVESQGSALPRCPAVRISAERGPTRAAEARSSTFDDWQSTKRSGSAALGRVRASTTHFDPECCLAVMRAGLPSNVSDVSLGAIELAGDGAEDEAGGLGALAAELLAVVLLERDG
jgi:hypothetical protein